MRGYQVCKGIWEASFGEELPYRRDNGKVRASLFWFNIASAFFNHSMRLVTEDPVDPGHCQRDTGTIESYSESPLSA